MYVPDASVHLFSVKAAAPNGYSTTLNEKEIVICIDTRNYCSIG